MTDDTRLLAALAVIQARGAIGERSLVEAVAHADRFVDLIPSSRRSVVDLGSGGGLPALVIAWRRADLAVTMVERRATRADMLRRAVSSLALGERVTVLDMDVAELADPAAQGFNVAQRFDVVTARSFGEVGITVRFVDLLVAPGGLALISEPPSDRSGVWSAVLVRHPTLHDDGVHQGIRRLVRR